MTTSSLTSGRFLSLDRIHHRNYIPIGGGERVVPDKIAGIMDRETLTQLLPSRRGLVGHDFDAARAERMKS